MFNQFNIFFQIFFVQIVDSIDIKMVCPKDRCKCCNVIRGDHKKYGLQTVSFESVASQLNLLNPVEIICVGSTVCEKYSKKSYKIQLSDSLIIFLKQT